VLEAAAHDVRDRAGADARLAAARIEALEDGAALRQKEDRTRRR
jgi:hypothetical protein